MLPYHAVLHGTDETDPYLQVGGEKYYHCTSKHPSTPDMGKLTSSSRGKWAESGLNDNVIIDNYIMVIVTNVK